MMDMTPNDLSYVVKHLSHGTHIHKRYYRTMTDVIERTKIGLLLTLKDAGLLENYIEGKKIHNITVEGNLCIYIAPK